MNSKKTFTIMAIAACCMWGNIVHPSLPNSQPYRDLNNLCQLEVNKNALDNLGKYCWKMFDRYVTDYVHCVVDNDNCNNANRRLSLLIEQCWSPHNCQNLDEVAKIPGTEVILDRFCKEKNQCQNLLKQKNLKTQFILSKKCGRFTKKHRKFCKRYKRKN